MYQIENKFHAIHTVTNLDRTKINLRHNAVVMLVAYWVSNYATKVVANLKPLFVGSCEGTRYKSKLTL